MFVYSASLAQFEFDCLILHADTDSRAAGTFKHHLQEVVSITNFRVAVYAEFAHPGQTPFDPLNTVFEKAFYVFVYISSNFTADTLSQFQSQMCLLDSLRDPIKLSRVIPVWSSGDAKASKDAPLELSTLRGIPYWQYVDHPEDDKSIYINSLHRLFTQGRGNVTK
jgi:hypothetical protein